MCKAALAKHWSVSALSPSGKPFATPAGHRPAWTQNISWQAGSALEPNSFKSLLPPVTDVVVAVGTLFENKHYKRLSTAGSVNDAFQGVKGAFASPNPLTAPDQTYQALNKNAGSCILLSDHFPGSLFLIALIVLKQFLLTNPVEPAVPRTFTFLSAEDFGRPFIPVGYIKAKREAEREITDLCNTDSPSPIREIIVRPGIFFSQTCSHVLKLDRSYVSRSFKAPCQPNGSPPRFICYRTCLCTQRNSKPFQTSSGSVHTWLRRPLQCHRAHTTRTRVARKDTRDPSHAR